jgi:hypothetical protein
VFSINFFHRGKAHALSAGGHYAAPCEAGFRDTPAAELRELIAEIQSGRSWREVIAAHYAKNQHWLYRIVTDSSRTAFFGSVLPEGTGSVLDIGSGWGQIARPLAACRPVVALEPVAERLAFIRVAAKQEGVHDHMAFVESDYFEIEFSTRFSAICAIGVLEWAGAFQDKVDPQERQRTFLRKARSELAEGGSLILGIENRLGLKYLLGCPDDHLGVPHVACLPAELARRRWQEASGHPLQSFTYSLSELAAMLRAAGFKQIEFFAAFPDYKLSEQIISLADKGQTLNAWLLHAAAPSEHNGYDGSALDNTFQETLKAQYRTLATEGIAHHFVPSFFIRAG